ncbi:hypothetical protein B0H11DRAFT_2193640 [Mycena galericulata]|nr:hypothetical protein B0H11DRAFT_2193640 [Mycena galericulata]
MSFLSRINSLLSPRPNQPLISGGELPEKPAPQRHSDLLMVKSLEEDRLLYYILRAQVLRMLLSALHRVHHDGGTYIVYPASSVHRREHGEQESFSVGSRCRRASRACVGCGCTTPTCYCSGKSSPMDHSRPAESGGGLACGGHSLGGAKLTCPRPRAQAAALSAEFEPGGIVAFSG